MNVDMYYRVACPHCKNVNWVDNGDPSDQTIDDIGGFECWNCHSRNDFEDNWDESYVFYEIGKRTEDLK